VELYVHSPNTPSWRGSQFKKKHRDNFNLTLPLTLMDCGVRGLETVCSDLRCSWLSSVARRKCTISSSKYTANSSFPLSHFTALSLEFSGRTKDQWYEVSNLETRRITVTSLSFNVLKPYRLTFTTFT